jgi:hypothetical protein
MAEAILEILFPGKKHGALPVGVGDVVKRRFRLALGLGGEEWCS